ncbi:MAG: DNA polymerase I, partial [Candidatus Omnitrophica bacterium]|nr:DNA polymerase I [Candidatus Omnitrophota bacterium]
LISQIPVIHEILDAFKIIALDYSGYEADDLIATLTKQAVNHKTAVVIVSDDKDFYQLLDPSVKCFSIRKEEFIDEKSIVGRFGFGPQLILDYMALAGDKVDNIPGVAGIGEVTAKKLITQYGSIEDIYGKIESVEPVKVREKLMAHKEDAILSKDLATLEQDVPIEYSSTLYALGEPDRKRLYELFKELDFRRLSKQFESEQTRQADVHTFEVSSSDQLNELLAKVKKRGRFAVTLPEVTHQKDLFADQFHMTCGDGVVYLLNESQIQECSVIFGDAAITIITHDVKLLHKRMTANQVGLSTNIFDVMLAAYLLGKGYSRLTSADLAWEFFQTTLPEENREAHACYTTFLLYEKLHQELSEKNLISLHDDMELPLSFVLSRMERQGVKIDEKLLAEMSLLCDQKIQEFVHGIFKESGEEFNLNSPKQLSQILFEKLNLPVIKKTKTGFSTDEGVLTKLAEQHRVPAMILEYRQVAKLKSTYIDALPKLIHPQTGRIHTEFNQIGTETGRLSSKNPNLQNIPIKTELGRKIRKAFIPSQKDRVIVSADYSQIELRILAHMSQDQRLCEAFNNNQDIHRFTASLMFDIDEKEVTTQMRYAAKRVNFGIVYGMSAFGLAKDLGVSNPEAQDFIDRYFLRYPKVKEFMDEQIAHCQEHGYVETLLKRRRYIPEIHSRNNALKQFAQRQAINTPVQGSAADLIKLAMIHVQEQLDQTSLDAMMSITVHDELVFDVNKTDTHAFGVLIKNVMERPLTLTVPLVVSMKAGSNWLDTEELEINLKTAKA